MAFEIKCLKTLEDFFSYKYTIDEKIPFLKSFMDSRKKIRKSYFVIITKHNNDAQKTKRC